MMRRKEINEMKKILKTLVIILVVVLVLFGLALAAAAMIPFSPIRPEIRHIPDQTAFRLDEKVGLYRTDDGHELMVTWGSYGGLTINDFSPVTGGDLLPVSEDVFTWKPYHLKEEYRLTFQHDASKKVAGFSWIDAKKTPRNAMRLETQAYSQAEIRFRNGGVELVGLLMTPLSEGPHAAVVFVHGSGRSIRDYLSYLQTADYLARHGCAVLLPDKRGCGKSGGEWLTSTFSEYADDALAGIDFLRSAPAVDPQRIGLVGVSQGGWVLPLAAGKSEHVRFIISCSGSATILDETMRYENRCNLIAAGIPRWLTPLIAPAIASQIRKNHGEFWKLNGYFDPRPYWQKLSVPALVLNGKLDQNVPVQKSVAILEAVRRQNPKANITIRVYEDSGHGLEDPRTKDIRADSLSLMAEWIQRVTDERHSVKKIVGLRL
jgi:dipeptidyl aminopeptidase/acylaminoacyl peptidase